MQLTTGEIADIGEGTTFGQDVSIAAFVSVGDRVCLGSGVFIGDDTTIYPNVTIMDHCRIGSRVKINAGSVIGGDGFGFVPDGDSYYKIKHTGTVQKVFRGVAWKKR